MGQGPHPRLSGSVLVTLLLAGCASTGPAPVEDLGTMPVRAPRSGASNATRAAPHASAHSHRVVRGDTLYSIAFRNGLDYRDVAAWNRIDAPYTIHVGQVLRLTPPAARVAPPRHGGNAPPAAGRSAAGSAPAPFDAPQPTPAAPSAPAASAPAAAATTAATPRPPPAPTTTPAPVPAPATGASAGAATREAASISWRWPASGSLVGGFVAGDPTRQGIDLAGKAGDPVRAAAAGSVVYSGNGLVGYGELVIIKHDASYLSAYGHNRKRMVSEGEQVQAGQVIAEMGSSSASRDSLHFEIRRNGKPVNPLDYLPRR